jgi:hypothetical protein
MENLANHVEQHEADRNWDEPVHVAADAKKARPQR